MGIDVINGQLVEVNVMSPGGITYMNKVYKTRVQEKVVDFVPWILGTKKRIKRKFSPMSYC